MTCEKKRNCLAVNIVSLADADEGGYLTAL
jgi:hypothetical protein